MTPSDGLHGSSLPTPAEAIALQKELAGRVRLCPLPARVRVVAAADLSYLPSKELIAVVLAFSWPSLELLETAHVRRPVEFPYVPGLLSFRELPAVTAAFEKLRHRPDVLLCDGQGLAHPRRFGLACHVGLVLDLPTVGCAKKRLCGDHDPVGTEKGCRSVLTLQGDPVGYVYRSRTGVKPIYVSPGHKADLESSLDLVERCVRRYRIPEPLRLAHNTVTRLKKNAHSP
ncbi:Endonuclease V [Desulfacinum hydrothermale DSM 13146]|uniref:Endonuclease V n=1 Tax=Desulfacinum hydrothermale DSM 13146 TaxID=1121390 RepID=A0A1W1XSU3_9BACT|nr:deoxyribonuclease V [Desulfacinum hydrothermale]SMC26905.1 Endonuclease V [Desulfacinum hydrothermale DSM 13146]